MKNKARIKIDAKADGTTELLTLYLLGSISFDKLCVTIEYEELTSDNEKFTTIICVSEDIVTVTKIGEVTTTLMFDENRVTIGEIKTPFGVVTASLTAQKVSIERLADQMNIELKYSLAVESGDILTNNVMHITVKF